MKTNFEIRPILMAMLKNKTAPLLVASQIALSLAILVNAMYIVNLRLQAAARPTGVQDEQQVFRVDISNQRQGGHEDQMAQQKAEAATIRAVPGVISVARVNSIPVSQSGSNTGMFADRKQEHSSAVSAIYISPDSLVQNWGLKLVQGRDFLAQEYQELDARADQKNPEQAIISLALARQLFPDKTQYIGLPFYFGSGDEADEVRIVGVVETLQTASAQWGKDGEVSTLVPARLSNEPYFGYSVRAAEGQTERVMKDVESALRRASPTPIKVDTRKMSDMRTDRYRAERGLAWMLITVSALLVVVTASGIVGMNSLWVAQRTRQIGIRRALGARRVDILRYFVTENLLIGGAGIAVGLMLAVGLNQLLMSQFELSRLPAVYLYFAPAGFWLLGLLACIGPAWRAAVISPATATRSV